MGYLTRVTGEIVIFPPLRWEEFRKSPFYADRSPDYDRSVKFRTESTVVDTAEGVLTRTRACGIVPWSDDRAYKAYTIEEEVREIFETHRRCTTVDINGDERGIVRSFTSWLEGEGEDRDDIWRLGVDFRHNRISGSTKDAVVKVMAVITWPDTVNYLQVPLPASPPEEEDA